ncbi:hypothetical protein IAE35_22275 [Pseudomonas sp. S75]|uniref:hypothetical protein n=1 Tax=unclassified Pseudomonas TaxID=196821 RepID=UPI0019048E06|nr:MULTISPECIES: hypothetical protein [unclassified Pseudomonas]MBJ9976313.1 hypothetical protein [Pseudomonas sp. S30]MBK0156076.1 hypothetical protein [Pseudomonas sp. S75]
MSRQRGVVLLLALMSSLLLGLLATSALREALTLAALAGNLRLSAQALEMAEAGLLVGAETLARTAQTRCAAAAPPPLPEGPGAAADDWQTTEFGLVLTQCLGTSRHAAHVSDGLEVTLFRVTAVSREPRTRQVLEAVYALDNGAAQPPRRIAWRQRGVEHVDATRS